MDTTLGIFDFVGHRSLVLTNISLAMPKQTTFACLLHLRKRISSPGVCKDKLTLLDLKGILIVKQNGRKKIIKTTHTYSSLLSAFRIIINKRHITLQSLFYVSSPTLHNKRRAVTSRQSFDSDKLLIDVNEVEITVNQEPKVCCFAAALLSMIRILQEVFPVVIGVSTTYLLYLISSNIELSLAKWAPVCVAVWFAHGVLAGWNRLGKWDHLAVFWGTLSSYNFVLFLLHDTDFKGWGDVYFFCGDNHEYCSCSFHWNIQGWWKAFALWNFSISFAFGLQKLALLLGLGGLLPGEEVVTKDSIISVCWRLVPYWLNNWEQNWGTECSSMLFEVPRFAMELLVILPCVQIVAARLKILIAPQIPVVYLADQPEQVHQDQLAVNIVKRYWEVDSGQRKLLRRLQANSRVMLFLIVLLAFAAFNSLWVPLRLEEESLRHPRAQMAIEAGKILKEQDMEFLDISPAVDFTFESIIQEHRPMDTTPADVQAYISLYKENYENFRGCYKASHFFTWALKKHSKELGRMNDFDHRRMIPLIEVTLAMMRLSCEKFFVLLTVYVNYLLFRKPPKAARTLVKINSALSNIFQHVVLYTFPAICWIYGAGIIFSSFVSLIFWGAPLNALYRAIFHASSYTELKESRTMTQEHVELMGGRCSICWGTLELSNNPNTPEDEQTKGISLSCHHAYHKSCLIQWTQQCKGQSRPPVCPMCQKPIEYQLKWRPPWSRTQSTDWNDFSRVEQPRNRAVVEEEDGFLFGDPHLQNILEEMPDIPANVMDIDPGHAHRIVHRQELQILGGFNQHQD